jgi:spermidine synthase
MYNVIGIGLTATLLYFLSYLFCRIGYYSLAFHRKLWNTCLAIVFLFTALAGVFMAIQISYKWDIPFIKTILKWHVEFGIGLSFTGIFHLLWHVPYFLKILDKQEIIHENKVLLKPASSETSINLFIVGFVSTSVQLLLIREMMNIAGGYELIAGTFLGSWLMVSAIGASVAGKSPLFEIKKIILIFALSPLFSLLMLILFSRLFLITGETPSFLISMIFTFIVLIPFCLVSGFTFIKLVLIARTRNDFVPGKSFSIETTGGIISGIAISVLTASFLNTYQTLFLVILFSIAYTLLTYYVRNVTAKIFTKVIIALVAACIIIFNPDIIFRQLLLPGISVTSSKDTPYGNITQGKYKGEKSLYYNQRLLIYNDDVIEREENIHYAMLQANSPEKVILISGSLRTHLPEILKYPVKKVIYIERDPSLTEIEISQNKTFSDKLLIENSDAFSYIRNPGELVDVIILLVPPPSTLLLNRYYTSEFFSFVKLRLKSDGIFMCSPGPGDTYFNNESTRLYSSVYNSLRSVFKNVEPVVGNKFYFIASDKDLSVSFCKLAETKNIKNTYVSSDYLSDEQTRKKSDEVNLLLDPKIRNNKSTFPIACLHFQSYFFSKYLDEKTPAIILMLVLFAVPAMFVKKKNIVMYLSAAALSGFEIIILLTLQLIVGNMYQLTGLIIAALMTGLSVGAGVKISFIDKISSRNKGILLIVYYLCFSLFYNYMFALRSGFSAVAIIIISAFIPSLFTGQLFRRLSNNDEYLVKTHEIYSADLAGSAFGFIIVTGITVPAFGVRVSILLLSVMILAGLLFGTIRNK